MWIGHKTEANASTIYLLLSLDLKQKKERERGREIQTKQNKTNLFIHMVYSNLIVFVFFFAGNFMHYISHSFDIQ